MNSQNKRQTGLRLYEDQIEKLDLLVVLMRGRKERSDLIREAIDEYLASKTTLLGALN